MAVRPAKTQTSLGIHSVWSVFAVHMKKPWILSYPLSTQWRLWSDWADAKAALSLRWAHTHFVGFVMLWLVWSWYFLYLYMHASPYIRVPCLKFVIGQCVSNMSRSTTNPTKWPVSKHSDKPGHPPVWSVFTLCMKKHWILSYPYSTWHGFWSEGVKAQADLSLHWVNRWFVGLILSRLVSRGCGMMPCCTFNNVPWCHIVITRERTFHFK